MKIGMGYDVHRLVEHRDLILGGVKIEHELGLDGHSDADVLVHAVMDALIGALGEGDIGKHFPDTNAEYKDVSSLMLLKRVKEMLDDKNKKIVNIDCVIICQQPKLQPYMEDMKENICRVLEISCADLNIKATTEEGLGFTGSGLGIASHAVCLIDNKF